MKIRVDNYLDRQISEVLQKAQDENTHTPSGKLSAGKLWNPLQWQILATQFGLVSHFDDYTLRKFQRGKDVEDWFIKSIKTVETQKFIEYRGVIGYCDSIVDTKDWDTPVGIIPLEVKSVANAKFKRIEANGADKGHILQNGFYAIGLNTDYHAITYIASDDYRILTTIYRTKDTKEEIDTIITEFEEAIKSETIPEFVPREKWQANIKYNNFPLFAGMSKEELKEQYNLLKI